MPLSMCYAALQRALLTSSGPIPSGPRRCPSLFYEATQRKISRNTCLLLVYVGALALQSATAQTTATPKALAAFEQQALSAFNPNAKTFSSITLNGSAVWTAGSLQETGSVVLKAGVDGSTAETWTLPSQSHARLESAWSLAGAAGSPIRRVSPIRTRIQTASALCRGLLPGPV